MTEENARIYLAEIPKREVSDREIDEIFPKERVAQIKATKNTAAKREKYFVWRLLEAAVIDFFGKNLSFFDIKKSDTGRWSAKEFDFSVSHSGGVCAVLISTAGNCGIDIEKSRDVNRELFAKRILTEKEFQEYSAKKEPLRKDFLLSCWCCKEALYKSGRFSIFIPKKTDTSAGVFKKTITVGGAKYHLAAAGDFGEEVRIVDITLD